MGDREEGRGRERGGAEPDGFHKERERSREREPRGDGDRERRRDKKAKKAKRSRSEESADRSREREKRRRRAQRDFMAKHGAKNKQDPSRIHFGSFRGLSEAKNSETEHEKNSGGETL